MLKRIALSLSLLASSSLYAMATDTVDSEVKAEVASFSIDGDVKKGKKVFKKCKACHEVKKEKNKSGPHLVGIIGRDMASVDGYKYSKALIEKAGQWTPEELAAFLKKPKDYLPGTKMAFNGLKKDKDIANVIAYLNEF